MQRQDTLYDDGDGEDTVMTRKGVTTGASADRAIAPSRQIAAIIRAGAEERKTIRFALNTLTSVTQRLMTALERELLN